MTENLIPTKNTCPSKLDFAKALLREWPDATKEGAGVLVAQFCGETGNGRYCWNWNLGNVKHVRGDAHDYVSLAGVFEGFLVTDQDGDGDIDEHDRVLLEARLVSTGEWQHDPDSTGDHAKVVGPKKLSLLATKGNAQTWFRAFASLGEAMTEFVSSKRDGHWKSCWPLIVAGDARGYALELGRLRYYSADPAAYAAALVAKHAAWMSSSDYEDAKRALDEEAAAALTTFDVVPGVIDLPTIEPKEVE